jgi:ArsR family transcriptional regulator
VRKLENIFKALSDKTRLRILALVWDDELCVCEIEKCLNLTQSNASRHITSLKIAGIISGYKQAQWAYYRLNEKFYEENKALCEYLKLKLKSLPNFQADMEKLQRVKKENLCNSSRKEE